MFDSRPTLFGLPPELVLFAFGATMVVLGFLWLRHTLGPDPLARGEARWRYRDRDRLLRLREWLAQGDASVRRARTRGWWLTRIEFGLAGGALAIATLGLTSAPGFRHGLSVPAVAVSAVGYGGIVFGIWWMRRLYRSPLRDAEPRHAWRYRDR
jgi:hypothetical protein